MADKQEIPIAPILEDLKPLYDLATSHRAWIRSAYDHISEKGARVSMWELPALIERISSLAHQLSQEKERSAASLPAWNPPEHDADLSWKERHDKVSEALRVKEAAYNKVLGLNGRQIDWFMEVANRRNVKLTTGQNLLREVVQALEAECERLRDRERDVCAAVTRQCDVKKINEIMQDTLKARDDRALLAARRTQERGNDGE